MDSQIEIIGDYQIFKNQMIGKGGQANVYMCQDTKNQHDLCVKKQELDQQKGIMDQRQQQLFNLLKDSNNENLVKMYDFRMEGQYSYLFMEYCDSGNIKQFLEKAVFPPEEILNFVKQFVNGYNELYKMEILHRDLKPANILIHNKKYKVFINKYQIIDLGISRTIDETQHFTNHIGTYLYWPPEQQNTEATVQHNDQSDMYSLGIILYEMLTNNQRRKGQSINKFIETINQECQKFQEQQQNDEFKSEIWYLIGKLVKFEQKERINFAELKTRVETTGIYNLKNQNMLPIIEQQKVQNCGNQSQQIGEDVTFFGYEIKFTQEIGRGQFGIVVNCSHPQYANIELCCKIIDNNMPVELMKEIQILNKLKYNTNQHVIKIFDIFERNGKSFIVMELCQGGNMKQQIESHMKNGTNYTATNILKFFYQFVDGYRFLYENKVMHGNIQPKNILLGKDGEYKIGNLENGRIVENMNQKANYTRIGAPIYSSPQVLSGIRFSAKTDIYSLGMMLFYLTFQRFPFVAKFSELEQFWRKLRSNPFQCLELIIEGTDDEKQEIKFLIERMIVYDEDLRIGFEEIFQRVRLNQLYQQFYKYEEENKTGLKYFLKVQYGKISVVEATVDKFCSIKQQRQITPNELEYDLLIISLLGYKVHLLKNITAIYECNYNNLCQYLKDQSQSQEIIRILQDFKHEQDEDDQRLYLLNKSNLNALDNQFADVAQQCVVKIDKLKIRLWQMILYRNFLQNMNNVTDYKKFLKFTERFFELYFRKHIFRQDNQLINNSQDMILFVANVLNLIKLEKEFPQSQLNQEPKILLLPSVITEMEDALQILNKYNIQQGQK